MSSVDLASADKQASLSSSLNKTKDSIIMKVRQFSAEHLQYEDNTRVPVPTELTPAFFTSLGLVVASLMDCQFKVPDGTLMLVSMQSVVFLLPNGVRLGDISLQPSKVILRYDSIIKKHGYHRLLTSAFTHPDMTHALFNANALLESGKVLEPKMGAIPYVIDVTLLTILAHELYVLVAWLEKSQLHRPQQFYSSTNSTSDCFSCVGFALNVVGNTVSSTNNTEQSIIPGIEISYHVWFQLVLTHIIFPRSSLFGHLIGIGAGLIRIFCPGPFIRIRKGITSFFQRLTRRPINNRTDDEAQITSYRKPKHLIRHLGLLSAAYAYYLRHSRVGK